VNGCHFSAIASPHTLGLALHLSGDYRYA
jgi:hypothetical protein